MHPTFVNVHGAQPTMIDPKSISESDRRSHDYFCAQYTVEGAEIANLCLSIVHASGPSASTPAAMPGSVLRNALPRFITSEAMGITDRKRAISLLQQAEWYLGRIVNSEEAHGDLMHSPGNNPASRLPAVDAHLANERDYISLALCRPLHRSELRSEFWGDDEHFENLLKAAQDAVFSALREEPELRHIDSIEDAFQFQRPADGPMQDVIAFISPLSVKSIPSRRGDIPLLYAMDPPPIELAPKSEDSRHFALRLHVDAGPGDTYEDLLTAIVDGNFDPPPDQPSYPPGFEDRIQAGALMQRNALRCARTDGGGPVHAEKQHRLQHKAFTREELEFDGVVVNVELWQAPFELHIVNAPAEYASALINDDVSSFHGRPDEARCLARIQELSDEYGVCVDVLDQAQDLSGEVPMVFHKHPDPADADLDAAQESDATEHDESMAP